MRALAGDDAGRCSLVYLIFDVLGFNAGLARPCRGGVCGVCALLTRPPAAWQAANGVDWAWCLITTDQCGMCHLAQKLDTYRSGKVETGAVSSLKCLSTHALGGVSRDVCHCVVVCHHVSLPLPGRLRMVSRSGWKWHSTHQRAIVSSQVGDGNRTMLSATMMACCRCQECNTAGTNKDSTIKVKCHSGRPGIGGRGCCVCTRVRICTHVRAEVHFSPTATSPGGVINILIILHRFQLLQ